MRKEVTVSALGVALAAAIAPIAQAGRGQGTYVVHRPVFKLVAPSGPHAARPLEMEARTAKRHLPNPAFAGYSTSTSGVTDLVARFRVPAVACSKKETAIGPGAFLLAGPHDRLSFNAANVIVGCFRGVASAQEAIDVNDDETDYVRPVQPGDVIIARLTDHPDGKIVVQLRNLNPHRRFVLTRSGRGSNADAELVGDWASADANTGARVPPPDFEPTTFRSISVNARPLGSASPTGYDMTNSSSLLQIRTSPLRGSARNQFTCSRRSA